VKLTTRLYLVQRTRINGVIPRATPPHAFKVKIGTVLSFVDIDYKDVSVILIGSSQSLMLQINTVIGKGKAVSLQA
jgi:hypothetical protein